MTKILIIGQAPPAVKQDYPYSTTMLYKWLELCKINKDEAQEMFEFDAIYNKFPGFSESGGHKVPSKKQMDDYWPILSEKIKKASKIIVLGKPAKEYLESKLENKKVIYLMHPSYRNYYVFTENEDKIINTLNSFIYD